MAPSETRQYEDGSENHLGEEQEEILYGFFLGHWGSLIQQLAQHTGEDPGNQNLCDWKWGMTKSWASARCVQMNALKHPRASEIVTPCAPRCHCLEKKWQENECIWMKREPAIAFQSANRLVKCVLFFSGLLLCWRRRWYNPYRFLSDTEQGGPLWRKGGASARRPQAQKIKQFALHFHAPLIFLASCSELNKQLT